MTYKLYSIKKIVQKSDMPTHSWRDCQ